MNGEDKIQSDGNSEKPQAARPERRLPFLRETLNNARAFKHGACTH